MAEDVIAKIVWAGVAHLESLDDEPEAVIERVRGHKYEPAALAEEMELGWPIRSELLEAAAWAGKARWALQRRDDAVRLAVVKGCPLRKAGEAVGMTHEAIRRIVDREGVEGRRW